MGGGVDLVMPIIEVGEVKAGETGLISALSSAQTLAGESLAIVMVMIFMANIGQNSSLFMDWRSSVVFFRHLFSGLPHSKPCCM